MSRLENALEWCLKQGGKEEKHKGLRTIKPDSLESERQIKKALSDLETMQYLFDGGKTDWVASAAFYAMYHSLLAVLYRMGYESRNQECTIIVIEKLVEEKAIGLEQEYVDMIRNMQDGTEDVKSIREQIQYGSETSMERARCKRLMDDAKKFVERVREVLEEARQREVQ